MKQAVIFARALADETRLRIIRLAMDQALCVCELAEIMEMPQSSVSSHVQVIRKAGLLESEKCEKWTYFRIHADFIPMVRGILRFFSESDPFPDDPEKAARRLAIREESCCPGPVKLAKRRKSIPSRS